MIREVQIHERLSLAQTIPLGLQHVFAMFGATVLVPFLTGLSPAIALLSSGIGTIVFLLLTKSQVPAYLGSSFAYIASLTYFVKDQNNLAAAMGGALTIGIIYVLLFALMSYFGSSWVHKIVPPVVAGPVVAIIGLSLTPVAADMSANNWYIAIFTLAVTAFLSIYAKGFLKIIPILTGIVVGYIVAAFAGLVDFTGVTASLNDIIASPVNFDTWQAPALDKAALLMFAPLAFVTIIEDLGHMIVLGNITHSDPIEKPGFNRVLLGNGLATGIASFLGGPPVTTYGENIGVLAVTRVYSTFNIWVAAFIAIILSFVNPLQALIMSIPTAVMGGVSLYLFGMIGVTGLRTLIEARVDFSKNKNLIIASVIFAVGIGVSSHGVAYATLAGIILNLVLREEKDEAPENKKEIA
ncbi:uracil-xanthine permease [Desulfitobacterium dehalogenans ATCC 51507]|uniref:Uracil-xanthine permease n=1 Tax=Desulfitobacterium dehalogenans (strain ATCC 51507 / DSM 9161 / JW/IU-DC1) TaxID=756499 RepID=I4ACB8_DESDJ|nr:solute carrier family 23 protein [Desulfitobacterium dehalogenans]AFM01603.1 uracil-xanthine permease [Desulfitobacterium dehalogenans ATCC 51507]